MRIQFANTDEVIDVIKQFFVFIEWEYKNTP